MKEKISPRNNKQDVKIGKLEVQFRNLKERLTKFIVNDFTHLQTKVDKIMWTVLFGFVISIFLMLVQIYLKIG